MTEIRDEYKHHAEVIGKKAAAESQQEFATACERHGVLRGKRPSDSGGMSGEWFEIVGRATRDVPKIAKYCDLTVFGGPFKEYRRLVPSVIECTLLASGRPILFVPGASIDIPAKRLAVAWDASAPACRAMVAADPFLQQAGEIFVLSVEDQYGDSADPQRLVQYLAWHGFCASARFSRKAHANVGHALLSAARENEIDFLIMGGYARHRFEEAVFGGTTRDVLLHCDLPVLLMH